MHHFPNIIPESKKLYSNYYPTGKPLLLNIKHEQNVFNLWWLSLEYWLCKQVWEKPLNYNVRNMSNIVCIRDLSIYAFCIFLFDGKALFEKISNIFVATWGYCCWNCIGCLMAYSHCILLWKYPTQYLNEKWDVLYNIFAFLCFQYYTIVCISPHWK